jgi:cyclopropane fatty-acyl-phospholipid synthase-like methyltransferase
MEPSMPVVLSPPERLILLRLNQGPGPLLDFVGALGFRAALAGFRLGVFDALAGGPGTADEIAIRVDADPEGTRLLLDALEALGYVRRHGDRYENSAMTTKWLPLIGEGVDFFAGVVDQWSHLDACVRDRGAWHDDKSTWTPERWRVFENGMRAFARLNVAEVVRKLQLPPTARRMLDLGGGHGLHSLELCRRHPSLEATVFDSPEAEASVQHTVRGTGMEQRVRFLAGDFLTDDLGADYDLVFVGNVVHGYEPRDNQKLFERIATSLASGGRIAILDEMPARRAGNAAGAVGTIMALNMYLSADTRTYTSSEIAHWLRAAGFGAPATKRLMRSPGLVLMIAQLP